MSLLQLATDKEVARAPPTLPRPAWRRCGCPLMPRRTRCHQVFLLDVALAGDVADPPPSRDDAGPPQDRQGYASALEALVPPPPLLLPLPVSLLYTHSLTPQQALVVWLLTDFPGHTVRHPPAPAPLSPPPRLPPSRERPRGTPALSASREGRGA